MAAFGVPLGIMSCLHIVSLHKLPLSQTNERIGGEGRMLVFAQRAVTVSVVAINNHNCRAGGGLARASTALPLPQLRNCVAENKLEAVA